ncbi:MAG: DEAD/DEAH box helicase [Polyangiales bacterium]
MSSSSSPSSFDALGLDPRLLEAIRVAGFDKPTAVQASAIPAVLAGRDVLARAPTGSGKTAAFGLPLLQRLITSPRANAAGNQVAHLVLVPTRELALQIASVLRDFLHPLALRGKIAAAYGGVAINPQMMTLRGGADIVVATPGRLLDLHRQNAVKLDQLQTLVLDEADRLLSLGFHDELTALLACLPHRRQNLLFSATLPENLASLTRGLLREPVTLDLDPSPEPTRASEIPNIEEHVCTVENHRKPAALIALLRARELQQVLVFVSMKKTGDTLVTQLQRAGIEAATFHADKRQGQRVRSLDAFRSGALRVLVATDLAARGLDIDDLPVVVNFELPRSPNDYSHRIGRTGRAGRAGLAISLVCAAEEQHFRVIERRIKRRIPREPFVAQ